MDLESWAEPWWPPAVRAIYRDALIEMDGDESPLEFGPSHIVWGDYNFDDGSIQFGLNECRANRAWYADRFAESDIQVVERSLVRLANIPEADRGDDPNDAG